MLYTERRWCREHWGDNVTAPVRSATNEAVYATVTYADVFDLPIHLGHLHRNLIGASLSLVETSMAVDDLVSQDRLRRNDDAIYLAQRDEVLDLFAERQPRVEQLWQDAEQWGERLGRLPLVRMVAVMGELAIGRCPDDDSIDFFIVVRPRRLWLARRLINKICDEAARAGVTLCPTYVASTRALDMEERSIFVALELAQMAVIVGDDVCRTVRRSNSWITELLPNATIEGNRSHLSALEPSRRQRWLEWFLLLPPFRLFEAWERSRSVREFRRESSARGEDNHAVTFSTERYAGHLARTAARVEAAWQARLHRP